MQIILMSPKDALNLASITFVYLYDYSDTAISQR